ncbi:hypothetical protein GYH30_015830 [Glycine max]|nr:hypothetical protein GYH30_015830 [Glycine max]
MDFLVQFQWLRLGGIKCGRGVWLFVIKRILSIIHTSSEKGVVMCLIVNQYSWKVMREEVLKRAAVRGGRGRGTVAVEDHVVDVDDDVSTYRTKEWKRRLLLESEGA